MLATVLMMALAVSVEPFRIGMTVLMLNRPRPALQLFAFLCGGFAMGTTVGLIVLFVFRRILLGTSFVTVPRVQLLIGLLVLFIAAVVAIDLFGRLGPRPAKLARPATELLKGDSLSVAGNRRPQHRAAVGRLPRRAGRHPGLWRGSADPSGRAGGVQRGGLRAR